MKLHSQKNGESVVLMNWHRNLKCSGQKFALLEEKAVLSAFFRRYRVQSIHDLNETRPLPEIILKPSRGFHVKIFNR